MQKPIFRMSQAGACPRALSAQLLEYQPSPPPPYLELAANEGKWHEERIKAELTEEGYLVGNEQKEVTLKFPSFILLGHTDGAVIDNKEPFGKMLLEIKSMSQYEFDRWMKEGFSGYPNYASQITCYMEATGLKECLYIVKNRSSGYEDRRVLTKQPTSIDGIIAKLLKVTWAEGLYPANFDPQSIECRRCNYKHLCVPEVKELTPVAEAGLSAAAKDWRTGKQLVVEGQELVDKAREVFEDHTKATNTPKWQHSGLAIQLVRYNEQKTYPKANLLKVFTEEQLEPASKIKEAYDQLRIDDLAKEDKNERD